jgi:hypothetical protein
VAAEPPLKKSRKAAVTAAAGPMPSSASVVSASSRKRRESGAPPPVVTSISLCEAKPSPSPVKGSGGSVVSLAPEGSVVGSAAARVDTLLNIRDLLNGIGDKRSVNGAFSRTSRSIPHIGRIPMDNVSCVLISDSLRASLQTVPYLQGTIANAVAFDDLVLPSQSTLRITDLAWLISV